VLCAPGHAVGDPPINDRPEKTISLGRYRFVGRMKRHALVAELAALHAVGVQHVGPHLWRNRRPLAETMEEIAQFVLPVIRPSTADAAACAVA
jgi:hypothetical protein